MRRGAAALAVAAVLLAAGCSDGKKSAAGTSTAAAPSTGAHTQSGGVAPSVATTAIPGGAAASLPATDGGTVAPSPTTSIPRPPASPNAPPNAAAPDPAAPDPAAPDRAAPVETNAPPASSTPGPTSSPVTDIVDGNPDTFCPAVDRAVPLYYVMSLGSLDGEDAAAAYEVAVAPALSIPITEAATSAPSVVAPPFRRWASRTAAAVVAFKAAGATDAQVASFGQAYAAQIEALTEAGGAQSPPDPIDAAVAAGVDRNRLVVAANGFVQANGSFEAFAATLGQDVTLTQEAEQKLERLYPCAADLTNFV